MFTALVYLGSSLLMLLLLSFFYAYEDRRGGRVFLVGLRNLLDRLLSGLYHFLVRVSKAFGTSFLSLLLHYGAYRLLKRILLWVKGFEHRLESMVRQNKAVAREYRAERERNHLDEIADHKYESALTEKQKDRLRQH